MATPISGRYASVRIGGSSTDPTNPGTIINNLGHWEVAITFDELDASVFGTVWKKNMTGMQGWTGTVEGFFDPSTATNTQIMGLMNAALDATKIQDIRFYVETSSGMFFMPNYAYWSTGCVDQGASSEAGAYISNVRVAHDKSGLASASFNVLGYGAMALFDVDSTTIVVAGT